ncbi:Coleoptile phototropism protein 1 [Hibiscus syriacus]|uniref:Coleoptile phototropism protein 1 n=1 Tax=Hibiscus syriacus TaxID=106335 RepID=A0A6A3BI40_HIBSY|nr:Coleoptile phototropism protein 1 [Hibiscus syriacus]
MWESETESVRGREYSNGVLSSSKHGLKTDGFELRGQSWYVATDIPSDLLVQVGEINFHLHKYPMLSRSGKVNRLIYESNNPELNKIAFEDLPGGPEAFELAAKFCYGIAVDLTAENISGLRCSAEYLEMTEDLEEGNLIFKTEAFLSYVVLSSWRDSILVLKSCEELTPWAENLQVDRSLCQGCYRDQGEGNAVRIDRGVDNALRGKMASGLIKDGQGQGPADDMMSISSNSNSSCGSSSWKGGLHMIVAGTKDETPSIQAKDQRMIIESLISIIPPQKDSVSCSFLLRLLRIANMLKVAPALVTELEKQVGMQFEQATLADLLIPSYNKGETMYDVDLVQRLLEHFLVQEQTESSSPSRPPFSDKHMYEGTLRGNNPNAKMRVARLVDSYLTEVSRDRNLSLTKFQVLAEALPESARTCDDGLYRAIDSYLKAHPTLSEHERKRLCRVMDCQKLSIDACLHAAQNERLPLRIVVQVLFSEQVKISNALSNSTLKDPAETQYQPLIPNHKTLLETTPQSFQEGWSAAKKDINTLKFELESVKAKYLELQNDMENLQRQFDKMSKQKQTSAWTTGWKKLSKLTKMTTVENHDIGPQMSTATEQTRKTPRRWRNSIS